VPSDTQSIDPIAITSLGCVTAQGVGVRATWEGVTAMRDVIAPWPDAPENLRHIKVAQCGEIPRPADLPPRLWSKLSRTQQLAALAADEALSSLGTDYDSLPPHRRGLFLATTTCGMDRTERFYEQFRADPQTADPDLLRRVLAPKLLAFIARRHVIAGPRSLCLTTCVGSAIAIGTACDYLHAGRIDIALAGGAETLCRTTLSGFNALKLVAPDGCRPFDKVHPGITVGEGAGMLVLERLADARARNANIIALITGFAATCDAHHLTAPEPTGTQAVRALQMALAQANLSASQIGYVNAHGTGTKENDTTETAILRKTFGPEVDRIPPVSSTKRLTGHTFGAAGAIETILSALSLQTQTLPANAGTVDADATLPLIGRTHPASIQSALTCNFAFGGNNTAIVLQYRGGGA